MDIDTAKITKLKDKFNKYGPYAIKAGLNSATAYLNTPSFKMSMYPPSQSGQPFVWSSEKQRRFVMANIRLPSVRTFNLANSGQFKVDDNSFWIEYRNPLDYAKWVIHPTTMIIGHIRRGWKPVNEYVKRESTRIVRDFKTAAVKAWDEMDAFIYGGGAGL